MIRRYGVLEDSLKEQRDAAEAERQRLAAIESAERERVAQEAEAERQQQGYRILTELADRQRLENAQPAEAGREHGGATLQPEQARQIKEVEQQQDLDAHRKLELEQKAEQYWQTADVQTMTERSLKIRSDQSHHLGRMRADIDELWEKEERRLNDEKRRIIEAEPNNIEKLERHEQHMEQMQEAAYAPKQVLVLQRAGHGDDLSTPTPVEINRQQATQRQQAADSLVQTLATQVERQTEETAAPAAPSSKSAQESERERYLAAFDRTYAQSLQEREQGHEQNGGRELGM